MIEYLHTVILTFSSNVYATKTMYPTNKLLAIKVLPFHIEGSNAVLANHGLV